MLVGRHLAWTPCPGPFMMPCRQQGDWALYPWCSGNSPDLETCIYLPYLLLKTLQCFYLCFLMLDISFPEVPGPLVSGCVHFVFND